MSEPVANERPNVDLDDFERRLQAQDPYRDDRDPHREDPLAELARLVGESHDPYGEVFAREAAAPRQTAPARASAPGMSPRLSGDFAAIEAGLRGAIPAHSDPGFGRDGDHAGGDAHADPRFYGGPQDYAQPDYAQQDHAHEGYPAHDPYARSDAYAPHDPYAAGDETAAPDQEDRRWAERSPEQAAPAARSRRPIYAMVATIAVGVIGVGVAFAYKGTSSSPSEIRTIAAASGPTKIQPPADASSDQTNQNSAMLGGTGQASPSRLVSGQEQPVDITQAVQENSSRNADVGGGQGDASSVPVPPAPGNANTASQDTPNIPPNAVLPADQIPGFGMSDMPAPKKVKVVSVRPDGTILSSGGASADAAPTSTIPSIASLSGSGDPGAGAPETPAPSATKSPGKTTSRVGAKPDQAASSDGSGDAPVVKPAHKLKPKTKTKAKPLEVASAEQPADDSQPAALPAKSGGGFAVQLAAPGSESDARAASARLAKKFASALEGRRLGFHKAISNGKPVFRVRVGSLSREDATSLCEKLKSDGGSCFVAKNN